MLFPAQAKARTTGLGLFSDKVCQIYCSSFSPPPEAKSSAVEHYVSFGLSRGKFSMPALIIFACLISAPLRLLQVSFDCTRNLGMETKNIIRGPKVAPLPRPLLAIERLYSRNRSVPQNVTNLLEGTQVQQWGLLHFQLKIRSLEAKTDFFPCFFFSNILGLMSSSVIPPVRWSLFPASLAESVGLSTRDCIASIHIIWITKYQAKWLDLMLELFLSHVDMTFKVIFRGAFLSPAQQFIERSNKDEFVSVMDDIKNLLYMLLQLYGNSRRLQWVTVSDQEGNKECALTLRRSI